MRRRVTTVLATICVALAAAAASNAAQREPHPQIRKAIAALERAKTDLQRADHDFCGHRDEALEATNRAIEQLRKALNYDKHEHAVAPLVSSILVDSELTGGVAQKPPKRRRERHPFIEAAIRALESAKDDLQHAAHDFGGHRDEAVEAVNNATRQLHQAIDCDKT
jgi:HEPN domain-containing protein